MGSINSFPSAFLFICPYAEKPKRKIGVWEKVMWTVFYVTMFHIFGLIPVCGQDMQSLANKQKKLGENFGTLMHVNADLVTLYTSFFVITYLVALKIIKVNGSKEKETRRLWLVHGCFNLLTTLVVSVIYTFSGLYGEITTGKKILIIFQYCFVTFLCLSMDALGSAGYGFSKVLPSDIVYFYPSVVQFVWTIGDVVKYYGFKNRFILSRPEPERSDLLKSYGPEFLNNFLQKSFYTVLLLLLCIYLSGFKFKVPSSFSPSPKQKSVKKKKKKIALTASPSSASPPLYTLKLFQAGNMPLYTYFFTSSFIATVALIASFFFEKQSMPLGATVTSPLTNITLAGAFPNSTVNGKWAGGSSESVYGGNNTGAGGMHIAIKSLIAVFGRYSSEGLSEASAEYLSPPPPSSSSSSTPPDVQFDDHPVEQSDLPLASIPPSDSSPESPSHTLPNSLTEPNTISSSSLSGSSPHPPLSPSLHRHSESSPLPSPGLSLPLSSESSLPPSESSPPLSSESSLPPSESSLPPSESSPHHRSELSPPHPSSPPPSPRTSSVSAATSACALPTHLQHLCSLGSYVLAASKYTPVAGAARYVQLPSASHFAALFRVIRAFFESKFLSAFVSAPVSAHASTSLTAPASAPSPASFADAFAKFATNVVIPVVVYLALVVLFSYTILGMTDMSRDIEAKAFGTKAVGNAEKDVESGRAEASSKEKDRKGRKGRKGRKDEEGVFVDGGVGLELDSLSLQQLTDIVTGQGQEGNAEGWSSGSAGNGGENKKEVERVLLRRLVNTSLGFGGGMLAVCSLLGILLNTYITFYHMISLTEMFTAVADEIRADLGEAEKKKKRRK